jgi:hypothetical protein
VGLSRIARRVHRLTTILAEGLKRVGLQVNGSYFDTLTVSGIDAAKIHAAARAGGINLREFSARDVGERAGRLVGIALDETVTRADVRNAPSAENVGAVQTTNVGANRASLAIKALKTGNASLELIESPVKTMTSGCCASIAFDNRSSRRGLESLWMSEIWAIRIAGIPLGTFLLEMETCVT